MKKLCLILLFLSLMSSTIFSANTDIYNIRQKAMGNVGVSIRQSGSNSLYGNPANLAYSSFSFGLPFRFAWESDQAYGDNQAKLQDLMNSSSSVSNSNSNREQWIKDLGKLVPIDSVFKASVYPIASLTIGGFGFGIAGTTFFNASLKDKITPTLTLNNHTDIRYAFGYGQEIELYGPTAIGASLEFINRRMMYDKKLGTNYIQAGPSELLDFMNDKPGKKELGINSLFGISLNLGVLKHINDTKYFTNAKYGLAIKNIGTNLKGNNEVVSGNITREINVNEKVDVNATIGIAMDLNLFEDNNALNKIFKDITVASDLEFLSEKKLFAQKIHLGIEKRFRANLANTIVSNIALRGGMNDGFFVGGFGFDLKLWAFPVFNFNFAKYSEEYGKELGYNTKHFTAMTVSLFW
ncbi:hypothetical protein DID75_02210 [Candidatus Marinamargulisbacteria bacterium SCGC AG-410-N11]|nr:hypothetical protein DID75_02210 [Candidatus Marinamargulisbacteria bacterium SCGC AG-410-N11]